MDRIEQIVAPINQLIKSVNGLRGDIQTLIKQGIQIMATEAALKAILDQLGPAIATLSTAVQTLITNQSAGTVTDADVAEAQAALDALNAIKTS